MSLWWLRQWMRRFFPAPRRCPPRPRRPQLALTALEDRVLLSVSLNLVAPTSSSYGVNNSLQIQYTNTGTSPTPAPVLVLSATNANLWLPGDQKDAASTLQMLATNPDANGPAGTLAPGASGTITVDFTSTTGIPNASIKFALGELTPGQAIDWSSQEANLKPSYIPTSAWNPVFTNFTTNVGSTTDSYQAALDADATYLAPLGDPVNNVAKLIDYEISKADADFGAAPLGSTVDLSMPVPGPSLSVARSFQPTVSGRNESGLFGLGWTSNWDIRAVTDSQGNVTLDQGGCLSYFALQLDGSYLPSSPESGNLTGSSATGYKLTAANGSITTFNADGSLGSVQDAHGLRLTAGYSSNGQMISLTAANGDSLSLAYNSAGYVSQITDPSGETAVYNYDAAGHLTSVTTPQGTTLYSYVSGTGTPADNALQTIVSPAGTQLNYSYDSEGRLTGSSFGTPANPYEPVTIDYGPAGGLSYTDANGYAATVLYNEEGEAASITDALGDTTQLSYDANGNLTNVALPGGAGYSYTYNSQGNLTSVMDALGYTTRFSYNGQGDLTGYTDAKGNTTSYAYNGKNDLASVTYANGAHQSYTYNPLGEATQFLNANGQAIGYSYNTQGQITQETFAGGSSYTFTYDADGNLTSATDAQGNVTRFVYGGDTSNTSNPDLLTAVEYPDGTYLKFSYYAGGQRAQSVDQTGFTVNYTYDAAGRLSQLTDGNGNRIVQYAYDPAGNLIQQDNGNGTRTVTTYNAAGNVLSITNLAPDHTTVNSFDKYTYDALGNVLTDTNQDGQWVCTYNADGELTQAVFTPNSSNPDSLTAQQISYTYDVNGNRASQTINGVTTTYTVNSANEVTSSTTASSTTTYVYDLDGNRISQTANGSTTSYTYNTLNQLTGISGSGSIASFGYDALGDRVSQTVNAATTNFQVDPSGHVVAAYSGGAAPSTEQLLAHYISGLGLISQVDASGTASYYDFGLTGNTIGVTSSAGSYVDKYSYLPLGQTTALAAALPNTFTFAGQLGATQDGSDVFSFGAGEYSATTGQLLSGNASGLAGAAAGLAGHTLDNPLSFLAPTGLFSTAAAPASPANVTVNPPDPLYSLSEITPADLSRGYRPFTAQFVANGALSALENGLVLAGSVNDTHWGNGSIGYSNPAGAGTPGLNSWNNLQGTPQLWTEFSLYPDWYNLPTAPNQPAIASTAANLIAATNLTPGPTATTTNNVPASGPITAGSPTTVVVYSGPVSSPVTSTTVSFTSPSDPGVTVSPTSTTVAPGQGPNQVIITTTVTFPVPGSYGVNVTVNGNNVLVGPGQETVPVYDPPIVVNPVSFSVPAGGQYSGPIATFTVLGTDPGPNGYLASVQQPGNAAAIPASIVLGSGSTYIVYANLNYTNIAAGLTSLVVNIWNANTAYAGPSSGGMISDSVTVTSSSPPPSPTTVVAQVVPGNGSQAPNSPLIILDTTDPSITSPNQVSASVQPSLSPGAPIPEITGISVTPLTGGSGTQIIVAGWINLVQWVGGLVASAPVNITLGNEPPVTTQVEVNETGTGFSLTPGSLTSVAGQTVSNVQVATLHGPANGSYSATISWGDGQTSVGTIAFVGNDTFTITGTKPAPYAVAGPETISVTVTGPGTPPRATVQTLMDVNTAPPSPPPAPPPAPPPPPPPPPPSSTSAPSMNPPSTTPIPVSAPTPPSPEQQLLDLYYQVIAQIEAEIQSLINLELALEQEWLAAFDASSLTIPQAL